MELLDAREDIVSGDMTALVSQCPVDSRTRLDLHIEVSVLDAARSFGKRASPGLFCTVDGARNLAIDLIVPCNVSANGRHLSLDLDMRGEVLLPRDALKVRLRVFALYGLMITQFAAAIFRPKSRLVSAYST